MKRVFFDSRSANTSRLTGWERFTKEIFLRIVGLHGNIQVQGNQSDTKTLARKLLTDFTLPAKLNKNISLVHFPTFPPLFEMRQIPISVLHIHDLTWWKYPETASFMGEHYYKRLTEKFIRSGQLISTGSLTVKLELQEFFKIPDEKIHVIYPGVSECDCKSNMEFKNKPFILSVGTIEPRKNLPFLIDAYHRSGIQSEIDLRIVGRMGWKSELPTGVEIMEKVDDKLLHQLYSSSLAVFQPSIYEGFGIPLIEAAMHGKTIICSDIPVFREVLSSSAYFLNPTKKDLWIEALKNIRLLKRDEGQVRKMGLRYTWEDSAEKTLLMYKTLL